MSKNTNYTLSSKVYQDYADDVWSIDKKCPLCQAYSFVKSGYAESESQAKIDLQINLPQVERELNPTILGDIVAVLQMGITPSRKVKIIEKYLKEDGYLP